MLTEIEATQSIFDLEHDVRLENNCVRYLSLIEQQIEYLDHQNGDPLGCIYVVGEMLAETIDFTAMISRSGLATYETVLAERLCEQIDRFQRDHRRNWLSRMFSPRQHRRDAEQRYAEIARQFLNLAQSVLRRTELQFRDQQVASALAESFEVLKGELSQRW